MTNCVFYLFMFAYFVNYAFGSINYFGVHRTFMLLYKGVIENSCMTIDQSGSAVRPYFSKEELKREVEEYFEENLKRYVAHYTVNYYFYNTSDKSYCTSDYCRAVKISLKANINIFFKYEKAREFYVVGG